MPGDRLAVKLLFAKANWETPSLSLEAFLDRVTQAGFDATELYMPSCTESASAVIRLHQRAGLALVAQISTAGGTPTEHLRSLEARYLRAADCLPLAINAHTGHDFFSRDDNARLFERGLELMAVHGVPLWHETHRGRALYTLPESLAYLQRLPELRLTADFSHWFCVHESDLREQQSALTNVIARTEHIHARVGFGEGPQVDPRNLAHRDWVERHIELWLGIVQARRAEGRAFLTLTPEFGPPPYMPLAGAEARPVADAWELNCWMLERLRRELAF